MTTITHGTMSGYAHHRCRCDDCKRANADYKRKWRRRQTPPPAGNGDDQ